MIEIWQADAQGRYASPRDSRRPNAKFKGFGRSATDKTAVRLRHHQAGPVPGPNGKAQAPHIVFCIFSRGMLRQIYTRLYFSMRRQGADPILSLVPADQDRPSLPPTRRAVGSLSTALTSASRATTRLFSSISRALKIRPRPGRPQSRIFTTRMQPNPARYFLQESLGSELFKGLGYN